MKKGGYVENHEDILRCLTSVQIQMAQIKDVQSKILEIMLQQLLERTNKSEAP